MQSKNESEFEKITCSMPKFSILFDRQILTDGSTCLSPEIITFIDDSLYQIFKSYLNGTIIESCRNVTDNKSVATYLSCQFDDNAKQVTIGIGFGVDNIVGKFFLETNLDWPSDYYAAQSYCNRQYKQPVCLSFDESLYRKGVPVINMQRQGKANIPYNIMQMMNNNEIQKFATLLAQAKRNPPSFFTDFPQDLLPLVANHLEPHFSLQEATLKLEAELHKADDFHKKNQLFSYKEGDIYFTASGGTQVNLETFDFFKTWFAQIPLKKESFLEGNYVLFKLSENILAINSGPSTAGIQVKKVDNGFIACNNLTADEVNADCCLRKNNLVDLLTMLKRSVKAVEKKVEEIKKTEVESQSTTCSIQ